MDYQDHIEERWVEDDNFVPCGHVMRTGTCNMDAGHRGRHTTVAWLCDGCSKMRRGVPAASDPEAGSFCFMCIKIPDRANHDYWEA
jgi:hypothetical protein